MSRYNRHILLPEIGITGQNKLQKSKVLVIGAGGLGCPILQYIAAAGIGTIGIVDFDIVEESNLQRQILFGSSTLGENKAIAAKQRLLDINKTLSINAYPFALTRKNALSLFEQYDIIVDGTDNFETRYLINDASIITNKPLVYGAIYKFEGQVSVFNYQNGPSYRCLFPNPPKDGSVKNCSEIGVLGVLPGIIGTLQANEVIKIILGIGTVLNGKLQCYNSLSTQSYTLEITKNQDGIDAIISNKIEFEMQLNDPTYCKTKEDTIKINDVFHLKNTLFIDIREAHETPEISQLKHMKIPFNEFEKNINKVQADKTIILFCQSGVRSKKGVQLLKKHQINNCYSLQGGALALHEFYKK